MINKLIRFSVYKPWLVIFLSFFAEQLTAAKEIYQFSVQRVENLKDKMYLGQKINLAEFSDALLGLSKSTAQLYVIQYQMKQNQYKMDRILWLSDFKDRPSNVPADASEVSDAKSKKKDQPAAPLQIRNLTGQVGVIPTEDSLKTRLSS